MTYTCACARSIHLFQRRWARIRIRRLHFIGNIWVWMHSTESSFTLSWRLHFDLELSDEKVFSQILFDDWLNQHMPIPYRVKGGLIFHPIHVKVLQVFEKSSWIYDLLKSILLCFTQPLRILVTFNQVLRVCNRAFQEILVGILELKGNISCIGAINIRYDMCWCHEINVVRICINIDIINVIV